MEKEELAKQYRIQQYIDFGDSNERAEQQIEQAFIDGYEKALSLFSVSGSFLQNYHYHPENEGTAKTFRNIVTEKWYYESELCDVIGITNVEYLKLNYR